MSDFDEKMMQRLKRLEREVERLQRWERPVVITDHGSLTGLGDNDHPQYLLTTGKAADSDKLDGLDSTAFLLTPSWTSWTPTGVGWTDGTLTGTFRYSQVGKLVYCIIAITAGTSNGTMATVSLPVQPATSGGVTRGTWGWGMDNGVQVNPAGGYVLDVSNHAIRFFKTSVDGATWTNSGTKRIYCTFFYEAA